MPPQRDQFGHLLDKDRAGLQAGAAGGAGPDRLFRDGGITFADQRGGGRFALFQLRPVCHQVMLEPGNHAARIKRLAGLVSRTGHLAAAAFSTGKGIQQLFPAVAVNPVNTEAVAGCELFPLRQYRLLVPPQKDVGNGGDDMEVLAERQQVHEQQQHQGMGPPGQVMHQLAGTFRYVWRKQGRDRHDLLCQLQHPPLKTGDLGGIDPEVGQHQGGDQKQDKERLKGACLRIGRGHQPADGCCDHRQQGDQRDHVDHLHQRHKDAIRQFGKVYGRKQPVQQEFGVCHHQHQKAPEDGNMDQSGRFGQHPLLGKGVAQGVTDPLTDVVQTLVGTSQGGQRKPFPAAVQEQGSGENEDRCKDRGCWCHR